MNKNYIYPKQSDEDIQYHTYNKREFYYHKIPERIDFNDKKEVEKYRNNVCNRTNNSFNEQQLMLSNFISPDTPYKGLLIFHGLGVGKTGVGIAIAEKFKPIIQKYNTKIYVLVSGQLIKKNWINEIIKLAGETYMANLDSSLPIEKKRVLATMAILQVYKFISYNSFRRIVLGDRIIDKKVVKGNSVSVSYKKTESGEYERDISLDRIYNLNNSLIIVEEAHNLTDNTIGESLRKIIKNSTNLRVILLTGTPMKNLADDIVELVNFIRPASSQMNRDKIFNQSYNHLMEFKTDGVEYMRNMLRGYVSHVRGADPILYAKRKDMGEIPKELLFTKLTGCRMMELQEITYNNILVDFNDTLDRKSESVSNFVFPCLSNDNTYIIGKYGMEGINLLKSQLKINHALLNLKLSELLFEDKTHTELIHFSEGGKTISGQILKLPYLKYFSTKFYQALTNLNNLVHGKSGAKTAFVYSNLVKVGIDLFSEILIQNGYLLFQEDFSNYNILPTTRCYYCGKQYSDHSMQSGGYDKIKDNKEEEEKDDDEENKEEDKEEEEEEEEEEKDDENLGEEDDTEKYILKQHNKMQYKGMKTGVFKNIDKDKNNENKDNENKDNEEKNKEKPDSTHTFYPATFLSITGDFEESDAVNSNKKRYLDTIFNNTNNIAGKYLKLILGSKVMNESISLFNVGEVHLLDVGYTLGKVDQVIGRAIRWCSHYNLIDKDGALPEVSVYKYAIQVEKGLSTEENLYRKAELKYVLIKKVERIMKEVALDCPLNIHGNIIPEEVIKYKDCEKNGTCPVICDFTTCNYKCENKKLNYKYYDPERGLYKKIPNNELDYSTFTYNFALTEIMHAKQKIKNLFILDYIYTLEQITKYVKDSYTPEKQDMFDDFFVYKALDELIPINQNDFNNFTFFLYDKQERPGYLIYRNKYYIFQPFTENENVSMYYRINNVKPIQNELSLYNYLKHDENFIKLIKQNKIVDDKTDSNADLTFYDFASTMDYYNDRDENDFVGFIDKELNVHNKSNDELVDVFKIREKRPKILEKKRGTGIQTIHGAVCSISKTKKYLLDVAKSMKININKNEYTSRASLCLDIEKEMLLREKYGTTKDKNKKTFVMIPKNHPKYPFPYNLEDRAQHIKNEILEAVKMPLDITISFINKKEISYKISIPHSKNLSEYEAVLKEYGASRENNSWSIVLK